MLAMINLVKWGIPLTGQVRPTWTNTRAIPRFPSQYRPSIHEFFVHSFNPADCGCLFNGSLGWKSAG